MLPALIRTLVAVTVATAPLAAQNKGHTTHRTDDARVTRVRLSTGIELDVAQRGRPDGLPVVFLHGYTDSRQSFSRVLPLLPDGIRAIVPTMRGHGESDKPACCYRIGDFAADIVALLDTLGIPRAAIVGHSLGSLVAQRLAIDHPSRLTSLVLIASGYTARVDVVIEMAREVAKLPNPVPDQFARDFQTSVISHPVPPEFLDLVVGESLKVPARVWRDVIDALANKDTLYEHPRIQARTLVISGMKDAMWDIAHSDSLARSIRGAKLLVYTDAGHSPNWEFPERVARDLQAFLLDVGTSTGAREPHAATSHDHDTPARSGPMPLLEGLGDWQTRVTTSAADAQRYFDQGLRLVYAFNHDEAVRSFERALQLDSTCAMCHWGVAYALGPNINLPMDPAVEPRALAASRQASRLKGKVTARERALIDAMAVRYAEPTGKDRALRDSAYAGRMRKAARHFRSDPDVQVIFADAMLNLRPWNQWTRDGRPQPGTLELVTALERVLASTPSHPGACHFYIHAIEASNTPERALPCAERLPKLMPGAGHVVHMPAHVFLRVGRYEDAARANIAAVNADGRYFASRSVPDGIYPMFYAPHNLHFLWATYLLSGQRAKALSTARALRERVKLEDARAVPSLEGFLVAEALALTRFGDWDGVLALPEPPAELRYHRATWHYARGMARVAKGDVTAAQLELQKVREIAARTPDDVIIILNPAPALLNLAADVLAGSIALQEKKYDEAIFLFRGAAEKEDALTYDEPPPWYHSARNFLGEALLAAGRATDAERAFRDDLRYVRETGWSLGGLERALRAQGKGSEADAVARRRAKAWQFADVSVRGGGDRQ